MSNILPFKAAEKYNQNFQKSTANKVCEIIIFPGIRYSTLEKSTFEIKKSRNARKKFSHNLKAIKRKRGL